MLSGAASRMTLTLLAVSWFASAAMAQHGGHGSHIPMPDQKFFLQCRLDAEDASWVELPLDLPSPSAPAKLNRNLALPAQLPPVKLIEYLPRAVVEQLVIPAEAPAAPAIELSIDGPTQAYQRWLLSSDMTRNRLTSFIGTWRYMAVEDKVQRDALFVQFETELTRPPRLLVVRDDGSGSQEIAVKTGEAFRLDGFEHVLRVRKFLPDFAVDEATSQPVARTERRLNPAVLVELEHDGKRIERWVFAKFPDFAQERDVPLPFKLVLDCPVEHESDLPDHVIVTVNRSSHEVWIRRHGKPEVRPFRVNERVDVAGSQYTFHIAQFLPSGRLVEEFRPANGKGGQPALHIEVMGGDGKPALVWLELAKPRTVITPQGRVVLAFGPKTVKGQGGH